MTTVIYLKHQIDVRPGTSSSGEVAFVRNLDGKDRCFLGGEQEARRFLRERKLGEFLGPRPATWSVRLDSGCVGVYGTEEAARRDYEYFRKEGRVCALEYTVHCAHPGCVNGEINERKARCYVSRPCPRHVESQTIIVESDAPRV